MKIVIMLPILILIIVKINLCISEELDLVKTKVYGVGIERPDSVVLPARYFFIDPFSVNGKRINASKSYDVRIIGDSLFGGCRHRVEQIDRDNGSSIIRYTIVGSCRNVEIHVHHNGNHVASSPYRISGPLHSENCNCPTGSIDDWLISAGCPANEQQIQKDLNPFKAVNFSSLRPRILEAYNKPSSLSICNYVIKNNEIYRNCYGQYTGFKMFIDAILLSLTRKFKMPDLEFFMNLGDWPLVKKGGHTRTSGPYPIFSWCGSDSTFDIVLPTYDITQSTLESMGSVSLDMLSVQKRGLLWSQKISKAFWRGRDSRRERLDLVDLSRKYPELINASLTNFFFFRDEEKVYGPKVAYISFHDFFDYKYQITLDGTVAAYRFPYLLAGSSVVLKQDSTYYEHFYKKLVPNKHFISFKQDLSNIMEKLKWAMDSEKSVQEIIKNAHEFAAQNLLPLNIFCYHALLFKEYSSNIVSSIQILPGMEKVEQSKMETGCNCHNDDKFYAKDEL